MNKFSRFVAACAAVLCAFGAFGETYYLAGNDSGEHQSSIFGTGSGAGWKTADGATGPYVPTAGNTYVIGGGREGRIDTQSGYAASTTFAGEKLIIEKGTLAFKNGNYVNFPCLEVAESGTAKLTLALGGDFTWAGCYTFGSGSTTDFSADSGRNFYLTASFNGSGKITTSNGTALYFYGDLSGYTGDFAFANSVSFCATDKNHATSAVLPGTPDELHADGFVVTKAITITFGVSGEFGANRGFNFSAAPTITVADGVTVTIDGDVAGSAGFTKKGNGTLVLNADKTSIAGQVNVMGGELRYRALPNATLLVDGGTTKIIGQIDAVATSCSVEKDGEEHGITVTVNEPAGGEGCSFEWSLDGETWGATEPKFSEPCYKTVFCRISAQGFSTRVVSAVVHVVEMVDNPVYVVPSGTSTPTVPYDTPAKGLCDFAAAQAVLPDGGEIRLVSGEYYSLDVMAIGRKIRVMGPSDRSATFTYKGLAISDGAQLSGVTFRNGIGTVLSVGSGTVVSNCLVKGGTDPISMSGGKMVDCEVSGFTGGAGAISGSGSLVRCAVKNGSGYSEGPVRTGSSFYIFDCEFSGNSASGGYSGGVYFLSGGRLVANRCRFVNNTARFYLGRHGGASCSGTLYMTNCLVANCRSNQSSCGNWGNCEIINCTYADNVAAGGTSGKSTKTTVVNSVFSGNTFSGVTFVAESGTSVDNVISTTLYPEAETGVNGNIASPAVYVAKGDTPYALKASSPGVNAGANLNWTKRDVDLAGNRRLRGDVVDMGCYECLPSGFVIFCQ